MRFYISSEQAVSLVERFKSFETDRINVRQRMEKYRPSLSLSAEQRIDTRAKLRELFRENAPDLRHHVTVDPWTSSRLPDSAFCWELADVAIVLDRSPSALSRTLKELTFRRRWRLRLNGLRRKAQSGKIMRYADGIFDLLIDFYGLSYLERFITPRTGAAMSPAEQKELLAFWNFMYEHTFMSEEQLLDMTFPSTRPPGEVPPDAGPWADRPEKLRMLFFGGGETS